MKIKKCGFLLSLVMLICFAIPSFASAETIDILKGKEGTLNNGWKTKALTDGDEKTNVRMFADEGTSIVRFDLGRNYLIESFFVRASSGSGYNDSLVVLLDSDNKILYSGSSGETKINVNGVRYAELKNRNGNWALYASEFRLFASDGLISNVLKLDAKVEGNKATLNWLNPDEEIFSGVNIFQDGKKIKSLDKKETSYAVGNLKSATKYTFKVVSVGTDGTESKGVTKEVAIAMPILPPPEQVALTPQNGSLIISWKEVNSEFTKGYNVYVDGHKVNDELLTQSKLNLKKLENGKKYNVQISTVNKNDVEGDKSKGITDVPSSDALTIEYDVKMPFSPLDLLTSSVSLLALLGGFILLSIAIIWFKPLKELIVKAARREKDKK
ncbi:fibronectin type III domain-containing protein [Bacillus pacificus]|uniref:fibronectin type III domain-containing protein n=1 Tax=Bacillus pacificus TaxID=2026187 RepID=UPI002D79D115|nr:fibronectin type III domain-containing protein [Bacillus pacificus]